MIKNLVEYIKLNCFRFIFVIVFSLIYSIIVSIVLIYPKVVDILFISCVVEFGLDQILKFYIRIKEKLLIHSYQNNEIEFNKEYYDIYWDYNLIISKIFIYCMYLSFAFVPKLLWNMFYTENPPSDLMKIVITTVVIIVSIYIIVSITLFIFYSFTDIKTVNELIEKKGQNYDSYNEVEKKILEQSIREREDRTMSANCIFCKIANGEIPSGTVYEDADFRVILDISPAAKGHCLILPKQHGKNLLEMDDAVLAKVFPLAKKIGQAMVKATGAKGFNVVQNNGEAAGQTVEHFHVHIIPRFDEKDSMVLWTPLSYGEGELEQVKESIIKEIHG